MGKSSDEGAKAAKAGLCACGICCALCIGIPLLIIIIIIIIIVVAVGSAADEVSSSSNSFADAINTSFANEVSCDAIKTKVGDPCARDEGCRGNMTCVNEVCAGSDNCANPV